MTSLSQFQSGGTEVGEIKDFSYNNFIIPLITSGGQEWLLTGKLQAWASKYSVLEAKPIGRALYVYQQNPCSWRFDYSGALNNHCKRKAFFYNSVYNYLGNDVSGSAGYMYYASSPTAAIANGANPIYPILDACMFTAGGNIGRIVIFCGTGTTTSTIAYGIGGAVGNTWTASTGHVGNSDISQPHAIGCNPDGSICVVSNGTLTAAAGKIYTSSGGATWTSRTPSGTSLPAVNVCCIYWSPKLSKFLTVVANDVDNVWSSADGYTTLTKETATAGTLMVGLGTASGAGSVLSPFAENSTAIIACGNLAANTGKIFRRTSTTWSAVTVDPNLLTVITSVAYVGTRFFAASTAGKLYYSDDDGATWKQLGAFTGLFGNMVYGIQVVNGKLMYCGLYNSSAYYHGYFSADNPSPSAPDYVGATAAIAGSYARIY